MRRWGPTIAAILAVFGAFGLVQIKVVSISPPLWVTTTVGAVIIAIVALTAIRAKEPKLPATVANLDANRARHGNRAYAITSKEMRVFVAPGTSLRRDADITFTLTLRNRLNRPLGEVELPLLGEVPASEDDLAVSGRAGGQTMNLAARVDSTDHLSPIIKILMPAPGIAPRESVTVSFRYVWPAVAHILKDEWILDVLLVEDGATATAILVYPATEAQFAEVRAIGRRFGLRRSHTIGNVEPTITGDRAIVEFVHTKTRGEELLQITTRPIN